MRITESLPFVCQWCPPTWWLYASLRSSIWSWSSQSTGNWERQRALWKEGNRDTKKPSKLNRRVIKSWVECSQEEGYPAQSYTERRRDEAQRNLKLRLLWTNESPFLSSAPPVNGSAASLLRSEIWCDRALPWDKDVPLTSPWHKASRSWCSLWASSCLGLSGNTSSHFHRLNKQHTRWWRSVIHRKHMIPAFRHF